MWKNLSNLFYRDLYKYLLKFFSITGAFNTIESLIILRSEAILLIIDLVKLPCA